ncbi:hypothetical protein DFH09DRAFT_1165877 [Mycena vulgaris]|nr:hypothetical protein DFH09DRAFT_1165877 [Mycena vulgaris]
MPPFSDQNQANTDLDLPLLIECSNNTGMSSCTIVFIFFILVFYALALWDRWLNLKLRESQKLRCKYYPLFELMNYSDEVISLSQYSTLPVWRDSGKFRRNSVSYVDGGDPKCPKHYIQ